MISRVRICNFKSLGDVTVDLQPITVLIGRSGTGKTNFVQALRFLRDWLISRDANSALQPHGRWERVLCAVAPRPLVLSFQVTFAHPGIKGEYDYFIASRQQHPGHPPQFSEEKLTLGDKVLLHQQDGKWIQPPPLIKPPNAGGLMLGAVTGVKEITVAYLVLTGGLGCYAFPDTIFFQSVPSVQSDMGLLDDGRNFMQVFNTFVSNLTTLYHWADIVATLHRVNPSVKNVDVRLPDRQAIVVSHEFDQQALVLDLSQESAGFRRILAHLLALYQSPSKQTLIFEEPETGIHPGALAALADEFKVCVTKGRGQVILTTHSPELLNHFEPEQLRVTEIHKHLTRIGLVAPDQRESLREHLLEPGELLTVDPARLTTAPVPVG
jgi:predicted ATPase